jgi:hypothetical protein
MTRAQLGALALSGLFLLVGVLGFIPGVTVGYRHLALASEQSSALLLGWFQVSVVHNLVHVVFGLIGLFAARAHRRAWRFLLIGGCVYLGLAVYGFLAAAMSAGNIIPLNTADNWLHVVFAAIMIISGLATKRMPTEAPSERGT